MCTARARACRSPILTVSTRHRQAGFSLAEIAMVLVVVGLLFGAVVNSHALIVQAQIKDTVQDFNRALAALHAYSDRYAAAPGDDARASVRWVGSAKNGTGDGFLSGAFQDLPPPGDPLTALTVDAAQGETLNFWWHLRLGGFLQYSPGMTNPAMPPSNGFGGIVGVQQAGLGLPSLIVCLSSLPDRIAAGVESQLDDGRPLTGLVRGVLQTSSSPQALTAAVPVADYEETGALRYTLCRAS
jgi:type II secretory pathway pseudopilin PulG